MKEEKKNRTVEEDSIFMSSSYIERNIVKYEKDDNIWCKSEKSAAGDRLYSGGGIYAWLLILFPKATEEIH